MTPARRVLVVALLALVGLYGAWFNADRAALLVFALPPLLCAAGTLRGARQAGFWAGVLALAWFSHGIMVAWTRPPERAYALAETLLALVVVAAASLPGLRARFGARRGTRL